MFTMMLVTDNFRYRSNVRNSCIIILGFGAQPPTPEWGAMLNEGRTYFARALAYIYIQGFAIVIVVIVFNMLGDNFRNIIDIKSE